MDTVGETEGETNWETSIEIYTLPCAKQSSWEAAYSTGISALCSVTTQMGGMMRLEWERGSRRRGHMYVRVCSVTSVMSNSLWPYGLQPARFLCPWEFSKQEYWSGSPCPPAGNLPEQRLKPMSLIAPALAGRFFTTNTIWEAQIYVIDVSVHFSSVQSLSRVQLFATPWITAHQASLSVTNSRSPLKLISIKSVMPLNHLILCRRLLLLPPIPPSIRVFSNESTLRIRWPKYWSFSFSISHSSEHPRLISFRMYWLDLLVVQGTLESLLQHTVQNHQLFGTQLSSQSNSYIHTWPLEKPQPWPHGPLLAK